MSPAMFLENFELFASLPNAIPKLRELVLELAVRGRLVPQDPNDEPAERLVERIKARRATIKIRSKALQADAEKLPAHGNAPFSIPDQWHWCRMDHLVEKLGAGSTPKGGRQVYVSDGVLFLRSQNVWDNGLRLESPAYITPEIHRKMSGTAVQPGDILLNITGASIGRSALVPDAFTEANVSQHVAIVRLIDKEMRGFVHLCLISPFFQREIMKAQVGISREGLSMNRLSEFALPLPPLAEQRRIVAKVDQLMALCDELERREEAGREVGDRLRSSALDALASADDAAEVATQWELIRENFHLLFDTPESVGEMRQTVLQLAVRGRLVAQDPNDEPAELLVDEMRRNMMPLAKKRIMKKNKTPVPVDKEIGAYSLPEKWRWIRLSSISDIGTGSTPLKSNQEFYQNGVVPWITSSLTANEYINNANLHISTMAVEKLGLRIYPPHTLIVALYGQGKTRGQISETLIATTVNQACAAIVVDSEYPTVREYVKLVIREQYHMLRRMAVGGAQPNLNVGKIKNSLIPLPPLAEQRRIVAKVDEMMALCNELEEKLRRAREEGERLMEAVAGSMAAAGSVPHPAGKPSAMEESPRKQRGEARLAPESLQQTIPFA